MWPFKKSPVDLKRDLQGHKQVTVNGMRFTIRRINPLLDFTADKVPQIFTEYMSRRPVDLNRVPGVDEIRRIQNDMKSVIQAGVVEPSLVAIGDGEKRGKEPGVTVEDVFRDPMMGHRLYLEILTHSLNCFRGMKGVFFSMRLKLWLWMRWRGDMESAHLLSFSLPVSSH
jgi:hypothetical protein